jgi:hypothetical protein
MNSGPVVLMTALPAEHTESTQAGGVTGDDGLKDSHGGRTVPAFAPAGAVIRMRARVGDRLVTGGDRIGEAVGVPSADGSPPYIIKWLKDDHIAMVLPYEYSRMVAPGETVGTKGSGAAT